MQPVHILECFLLGQRNQKVERREQLLVVQGRREMM